MDVSLITESADYRSAVEAVYTHALAVDDPEEAERLLDAVEPLLEARLVEFLQGAVPGNGLLMIWASETQIGLPELRVSIKRDRTMAVWRSHCQHALERMRQVRSLEVD